MFALYIVIAIGAFALFEFLFPEVNDAMCHWLYKKIMGGEDF